MAFFDKLGSWSARLLVVGGLSFAAYKCSQNALDHDGDGDVNSRDLASTAVDIATSVVEGGIEAADQVRDELPDASDRVQKSLDNNFPEVGKIFDYSSRNQDKVSDDPCSGLSPREELDCLRNYTVD